MNALDIPYMLEETVEIERLEAEAEGLRQSWAAALDKRSRVEALLRSPPEPAGADQLAIWHYEARGAIGRQQRATEALELAVAALTAATLRAQDRRLAERAQACALGSDEVRLPAA